MLECREVVALSLCQRFRRRPAARAARRRELCASPDYVIGANEREAPTCKSTAINDMCSVYVQSEQDMSHVGKSTSMARLP